ncbi:hypothetical protein INR49_024272 [Caranx melampygus]|nr:hypothetical protein INR49_024272 [Caranx melampygus]
MSSPLSMLKKTRRAPLQGSVDEQRAGAKVPFRRSLLKEFQAVLVDGHEDDSSKSSHVAASDASTSKSKAPLKKAAPPSDFELMSAMMRRVTLLEKKVRSQAQEIESKNKKISVLEKKLKDWKESDGADDLSSNNDLERRVMVSAPQSFLSDYGLIWVGDGETYDSECEQTHSSGTSGVRAFCMNFDLVMQRIAELNILAGEGESFVKSTSRGAQLATKEPVQLRLYSNGIVMFDGPFRSYQEHSTQQCMQDLMDGYFPSELQERFPDGVPFEAISRSLLAHAGKKVTMNQFLNRLPKVVVKAGRVIDIRDSLRATLQGSPGVHNSDSVVLIDTAALQAMKERLQTPTSDRPLSSHDVITLKVKSEDGNHTYVLKMFSSETIGHLRRYLDKHRGGSLPGYDIISAYPQRRYEDNCRTLQSCGIVQSATLLLQKRQHPPHPLTESFT